ncbi:PDR/VanB family oxidoreductase [Methylobacterium nonmethylotrophicum]|uniref:Oxidoreductase n=1 Tax=Methylobacterium nonmethylotrophicum TaxID=1141884 RepID=A0A4Z0NGC7_9HYPH|nr:PDR/VanB family oxidoreductase [Methylobacterium nonmethylotrophicum]TGD94275.1 oxidoreductase [Methylobacterium nonmethylotrophicum]
MTQDVMNLCIVRRETQADVVVIDLADPGGADLPAYEAGAHVDVHVGNGLVRQYSLAGNPAERGRYRLGILLDPASRGGSAAIHRTFRVGESVLVGRPRNHFPLVPEAAYTVLIGGGIGITPLLSMAHALLAAGRSFELHYCARDQTRAAFLTELAEPAFAARTHLHFDDGPADQRLDLAGLPPAAPGTHLYVCGPTGFMDWVVAGARQAGFGEDRLHREDFRAAIDATGDAFEVVVDGRTVTVPSGLSIVKALAEAGITVEVSCENGVCGTCLCTVLDGIPDHRDTYLTDEEKQANDQMLLCCSRAKTPQLVIEL